MVATDGGKMVCHSPIAITAVHLKPGNRLDGPTLKEKHNRGHTAWLIRDTVTKTVYITQQLAAAVPRVNVNAVS